MINEYVVILKTRITVWDKLRAESQGRAVNDCHSEQSEESAPRVMCS